MKLYSWNVNGFRAVLKKDFRRWFDACGADVVCLQETKAEAEQVPEPDRNPEGWTSYWNSCKVKKGYSGVASFCRSEPLAVTNGLADERYQGEGRVQCMEYDAFWLFNIYFPNGQKDDERLQYKLGFYDAFLEYAEELRAVKPIVVCGDFNTAHKEIDLARPKENQETSGFLPVERAWLDKLVDHGYVDTLRMFTDEGDLYSWWTYRFGARSRNVGWRIDYFFVSDELRENVKNAWVETEVMGSDHCPVGLELDIPG